MGEDEMDAPVWKCQSDLPVVASNAIRFPSPVARKTSPLVARTPAPIEMRKIGYSHFTVPVVVSMAKRLLLAVSPDGKGAPPTYCRPASYFTGMLRYPMPPFSATTYIM